MTLKEYIIASIVTGGMMYMTATITDRRHEQNKQVAINNAIAYCGQPNDCNTSKVVATLQSMANNNYELVKHGLCWASSEEDMPDGN